MNSTPSHAVPRYRAAIAASYRLPETRLLPKLIQHAHLDAGSWPDIQTQAQQLIEAVRAGQTQEDSLPWVPELLQAYPLGSNEGRALMALAECALRIPDRHTLNKLLQDKLTQRQWRNPRTANASWPVKASAWALQLCQHLVSEPRQGLQRALSHLAAPMMMRGTLFAMRMLGNQFVYSNRIQQALTRAAKTQTCCSFDMLGEAARTQADARRYFDAYRDAILAVGKHQQPNRSDPQTISIKLSALHPRYEALQAKRAIPALVTSLTALAEIAQQHQVGITIDAEECDRLEMSLDIIEQLLNAPSLRNWQGLSVAVQAYQKRALAVIQWLNALASSQQRTLGVRLVKGAYWDMEIKRCQERGLTDFPVFTHKAATDISYLACARELLASEHLAPAFATHNALTIATLLHWLKPYRAAGKPAEFQRLHGMAGGLYRMMTRDHGIPCRVYSPVGLHHELLPYLIRRMLENSSNSGFVQQLSNPNVALHTLLDNPIDQLQRTGMATHHAIMSPSQLFKPRSNSIGLDLSDRHTLNELQRQFAADRPTRASTADAAAPRELS